MVRFFYPSSSASFTSPLRSHSQKGMLDEARGVEQHNITEAAKNELNLARVGKVMRSGHRQGGGVGGCSSGVL